MKILVKTWILAASLLLAWGCAETTGKKEPPTGQAVVPQLRFSDSGGKTAGPLKITRIELNFSNHRGDITVPVNSRFSAYAVIRFDGNGLFQAAWVADGRTLENISVNVVFGKTLTLHTGQGTVIPTFEPGSHSLNLKIHAPVPEFEVPEITYFVTGG